MEYSKEDLMEAKKQNYRLVIALAQLVKRLGHGDRVENVGVRVTP